MLLPMHLCNVVLFARCCCGHLIGEHSWQDSLPPLSLCPGPGQDVEEEWSMERHTRASPTNAYGTVDFEDTATRVCRAKVCEFTSSVRVSRPKEHFFKSKMVNVHTLKRLLQI